MENRYRTLEAKIEEWAKNKGIMSKGTPTAQALKTLEECNELIDAIDKEDLYETSDAIGDILITLIIQAEMQGLNVIDCLQSAYDIVNKRTGKMVQGMFVKDKPAN